MWFPRVQFSIRGMIVAVAGSAVVLAYLGTGSAKLGCGETSVRLTFHVVDDRDGRPIAGARIELIQDYSAPPTASTMTGSDGSASLTCRAGCTWYSGPFFRPYRRLFFVEALQIQAEGYRSVDRLLKEHTGSPALHDSAVPLPIPIRLKRSPETEAWQGDP
jgi:hypothetical protein